VPLLRLQGIHVHRKHLDLVAQLRHDAAEAQTLAWLAEAPDTEGWTE